MLIYVHFFGVVGVDAAFLEGVVGVLRAFDGLLGSVLSELGVPLPLVAWRRDLVPFAAVLGVREAVVLPGGALRRGVDSVGAGIAVLCRLPDRLLIDPERQQKKIPQLISTN